MGIDFSFRGLEQKINEKTVNEFMETKKIYLTPAIDVIKLDNEISLALESAPPTGPDETFNSLSSPEYLNSNPLIDNIG
jgi:hypothetical protein